MSVLLFAAALTAAPLAPGDPLPPLKGEFLTGEKAVLPDAARGKYAFLALGFTYDSRFAVEEWTKRFRKEFGAEESVTFFEVPMIGGMARLGKWFIDSGMRRGTPVADHRHVITVYGGVEPWKRYLRYARPNDAYLVLLSPDGKVAWLHAGVFEESAFQQLSANLRGKLSENAGGEGTLTAAR